MFRKVIAGRCVLKCALLMGLPVGAVPVFQVQAVGPAGFASSATAISGTGAVAGNYQQPDGTHRAFLWQNGQVTSLVMPAGSLQTWANAIGGAGQAGGYTDSQQAAQGVIWDNFGNPMGTAGAYIMGMNKRGDAAGMAIGSDGGAYAFLSHNGVMTSLGQPGGGSWSSANAINNSGTAAGTAMNRSGFFQGFSADANGGIALLSALGGANSYGMAISDSGVVAGHSQTASGAMRATVWNDATATGLGTLGGVNSYAYAINAAGQVAGYSDVEGSGVTAAFLFDKGVLYDLNALLIPGAGWQLLAAYGTNNVGQIVGKGIFNGVEQAFLLTPVFSVPSLAAETGVPEPAALWLVGVPVLAFFALRGRHR